MQLPFRQKTIGTKICEQESSNDVATSAEDLAQEQPQVRSRAEEHKPRALAVMGYRFVEWQITVSAAVLVPPSGEYIFTLKLMQKPTAKATPIPPHTKPSPSITGPVPTLSKTQNKPPADPRYSSLRGAPYSIRSCYITALCNCACFRAQTNHTFSTPSPSHIERLIYAHTNRHPARHRGWPRTVI